MGGMGIRNLNVLMGGSKVGGGGEAPRSCRGEHTTLVIGEGFNEWRRRVRIGDEDFACSAHVDSMWLCRWT